MRAEVHGLVLDRVSREAALDGERIHLGRMEFNLLWFLATEPTRVFTHQEITDALYGGQAIAGSATGAVRETVCRARKKLGPGFLRPFYGFGYRLLRDVEL